MAKTTFSVLMVVETLAALVSMGLLFSDVGAMIYPISLAIFAAVLAPFYLWMKKVEEAKKRKIRLWMVLIMLSPIVVAIAAVVMVVIALMLMPY